MSDTSETWNAVKEARNLERGQNRVNAAELFSEAHTIAATVGLTLTKHSDSHYSLANKSKWRLEIYPGNKRLYRALNKPHAPRLDLPPDWTLVDVVMAAARKVAR